MVEVACDLKDDMADLGTLLASAVFFFRAAAVHAMSGWRESAGRRRTAVAAQLKSKQLLLFAFALYFTAVQRHTAVTAYLKSI